MSCFRWLALRRSRRLPHTQRGTVGATWLDGLVLPLCAALMEAQPASLLLAVGCKLFGARSLSLLLFPQSDWLLSLGGLILFWWDVAVEYWSEHWPQRFNLQALARLFPLVVALIAVGGLLAPRVLAGQALADLLLAWGALIWLWRRALTRNRLGFEHEAQARSFRIGFLLLLAVLGLALLAAWHELVATLDLALPLFFGAGLLTLSLARLNAIRRQRRSRGGLADPTRPWLLALGLLSLLIVLLVAILESFFSFASFQEGIGRLLPLLGTIWNWLSGLVLWLIVTILTPLFDLFALIVAAVRHSGPASGPAILSPARLRQQLQAHQGQGSLLLPPALLVMGRLLLLALFACGLAWLVLRVVRLGRWQRTLSEVDEEREMLNPLALISDSWRQRRRRLSVEGATLEPLDPTSLRWLYRAWLQALARYDLGLARRPAETPLEYLARLSQDLLTSKGADYENETAVTTRELAAFSQQLTEAYLDERYGNHPVSVAQLAALYGRWRTVQSWLRLARRRKS